MNLIYILKAITIAQLCFLIFNFLFRVRFSARNLLGSLFCASLIFYFLCPMFARNHAEFHPILIIVVHMGCYSVSIFFYLFVRSLFEDEFRLRIWHGLLFVFINCYSFTIFFLSNLRNETEAFSRILFSTPQLLYLALILLTLGKILKDRSMDLMESRREFRTLFAWVTGLYAICVVLVEVIVKNSGDSSRLDLLNSISILLLVYFFSFKLFEFRGNIFPMPETKSEEEPVDEELLRKLNRLLETEKIFLRENLTILALAKELNVPEKKIRKLINQGLGYRNFNEFLNHFRIREAKTILADSTKYEIPVLRIAMDLGYGSLAPFNRAFKEIAGNTPTEFRKQNIR
ncbi:helix-turn-helix domain-containing protein [Leptospira kmetyi]|uniref:helix-turn-helix domain-containing protein n=1 Tax=Leptospira kmetyi TaxID=408139 RepID=UPI001082C933|nr:helix-turn-helix domain-containing protein [Leptospira kmetyi]TGK18368.1 AraC family transcriptional regulator [Leptospira kmetyi]TGK26749.1 AraC family transcriptional regulator [Leptospira kmetyi]